MIEWNWLRQGGYRRSKDRMEQRQYGKIETGCNGQYRQDGIE